MYPKRAFKRSWEVGGGIAGVRGGHGALQRGESWVNVFIGQGGQRMYTLHTLHS